MKKKISRFLAVALVAMSPGILQAEMSAQDSLEVQKFLDSAGTSMTELEAKVQSTLMFGGSSPVSFSGEGRLKLQHHNIDDPAQYLARDKTYLQSNWEGNESFVRLGMVVRAGRNTVLWSKIGFQSTLPGTYINRDFAEVDNKFDNNFYLIDHQTQKDGSPAIIHEDMNAGIAVRTVPASFWLKLGAVHWIEANPLTIWKAQPRTFAWEYLPYEVEQPIARYYEYNIAKGEKSGRAAWNKKALQGINFESINLPANLFVNFLYGTYERFDNFEREFIDFSNDIAYSGETTDAKGIGIGDSYRKLFFARIGAKELIGRLTPSVDFVFYKTSRDIFTMKYFKDVFAMDSANSNGFYKEPFVTSFDLRGPLNEKLGIHANIAFNGLDTSWIHKRTDTLNNVNYTYDNNGTGPKAALYLQLESKYGIPLKADIAVISKGFYSPLSFAAPVDAFYPFGANLLGPGKFIGRGEASPYTQNMAGINLQAAPQLPGYGHFKITYGQHFQLEKSQDVIFFPYRLNGQDLYSMFQSSYVRWGSYPVDMAIKPLYGSKASSLTKYQYRMGDEGFRHKANLSPRGPMAGGLRTDFLSAFEGFVPYYDSDTAEANFKILPMRENPAYSDDLIYQPGKHVPEHQKFTFNLEVDWSNDIGPLVGYSKDLFLSVYAALNGVSKSLKPLAFSEQSTDMLLWGTYVRFEPAIALSSKLYILGLAGFENWRAGGTYMYLDKLYNMLVNEDYIEKNLGAQARTDFENGKRLFLVPIDYRDIAFGIGFDWDFLPRAGLHGRVKWMRHRDVNFKSNSFETPVISAEIKTWF
jgi:hypothetical protein